MLFHRTKNPLQERVLQFSGGDRNRTGVQTYPLKAFYMLISLLLVGNEPEMNKPIHYLAGFPIRSGLKRPSQHSIAAFCICF